jgi:hypothetical protein
MAREDEHRQARGVAADLRRQLEAVHARQVEVDHRDVRLAAFEQRERVLRAPGGAPDREPVVGFEQLGHRHPHRLLVLDEEHVAGLEGECGQ